MRLPRAKTPNLNKLEFKTAVNEAKLVKAIQALDDTWKTRRQTKRSSEDKLAVNSSPPPLLSDSLREALCFLMEVAANFDKTGVENTSALATICTARVLNCLRRFIDGNFDTNFGDCCERNCELRLVHLALLNIVFRMCREPRIACNVVRENLHLYLIRICTTSKSLDPTTQEHTKLTDISAEKPLDPLDLMITIDPFDWCYRSSCMSLEKENHYAFFTPVGIRSVTCLLRGTDLPTDELTEFELSGAAKRAHKKHHKLPTIFAFPHRAEDGTGTINKHPGTVCYSTKTHSNTQPIWSVVCSDASIFHLALRSLVALAIHLPQPSPERKSLFREGSWMTRVLEDFTHKPGVQVSFLPGENEPHASFQFIAVQPQTMKSLARCVLKLFTQQQYPGGTKQQKAIRYQNALSPIPRERRSKQNQMSIAQRLKSATTDAHAEFLLCNGVQDQDKHLEHSRKRLAVQNLCTDVESVRDHLMRSLQVLYTGRSHPDPQQRFSDWIKSLPTIDTFQQERQYQQELRQRQTLEMEYQRDFVRRREREECLQMQVNDCNIPEENELSRLQEKQQQFSRLQAEMRQLEQHHSNDTATLFDAKLQREEEERQRLQQLEDQKRQVREVERMQREDLYYVERILRAKAKAKEEEETREKSAAAQAKAIEEQKQRIARMRFLDDERRIAEGENTKMRVEDLLGRQMRFHLAEMAKAEIHNEWHERKSMQAEEQDSRNRWILAERAMIQQQQAELKQQRAQERKLRRQQRHEEDEVRAAWTESWDDQGNKYYYNSITGVSQWESPST